jgi:serine protease AprX
MIQWILKNRPHHTSAPLVSVVAVMVLGLLSLGLKPLPKASLPENTAAKISPWVINKLNLSSAEFVSPSGAQTGSEMAHLKTQMKIPILVILKEHADLSGANSLATKAEKGRFVYQQLTEVAQRSQADLIGFLKGKSIHNRPFFIVNLVAVYDANAELVRELARRSDVERIVGNPTHSMRLPVPQVLRTREELPNSVGSNLTAIGTDRVWNELGVRGAGIVLAGQDTGYDLEHPAIRNQYRGRKSSTPPDLIQYDHAFNWHDAIHEAPESNPCGANSLKPCDDSEHGTHTMGSMLGDDGGSNKIGMAPEAQWVGCRNMEQGQGSPATYTECFEWFLSPWKFGANPMTEGQPDKAPHIINNSWGCPYEEGCEGTEMKSALEALEAAGIMVVVSAGNEGSSCQTINDQPASHSQLVFSIGAFDHKSGNIAYFSSRGPSGIDGGLSPHVAAPGVGIRSSVPGGTYMQMSGTSMAGPHVAGLVALVWSAQPKLIGKIQETKELIESTAVGHTSDQSCGKYPGSEIPNAVYGYGNIDAYAAVKKAQTGP